MSKSNKFIAPCPDCGKGEMKIEKFSIEIEGKEGEPYDGYNFVCAQCLEKTFICVNSETEAIDVWNRLAPQIKEMNECAEAGN